MIKTLKVSIVQGWDEKALVYPVVSWICIEIILPMVKRSVTFSNTSVETCAKKDDAKKGIGMKVKRRWDDKL